MEQPSMPSLVVAHRRSYHGFGMDPFWDEYSASPLNPSHNSFFFSAPTSPRAWQNDNLNPSSVPDLSLKVGNDDDDQHKQGNDGNDNGGSDSDRDDEEFEFRSPACESNDPPFTPTLSFSTSAASSSPSISFPPVRLLPPPILKPPPFLLAQPSKPCPVSVPHSEEDSLVFENPTSTSERWNHSSGTVVDVHPIKEAAEMQKGKPSKAKKWRFKDLLRQSINRDKRPDKLHRRRQGSMLSASSVFTGNKAMNGTAMGLKVSPQSFPLPTPPPILKSALPTPKRKPSTASPSSHEVFYAWKRVQQKKSSLPYCLGFLGFTSKRYAYAPIADLSMDMQPVK